MTALSAPAQPPTFMAGDTPAAFRSMLGEIRGWSGLSGGQIAVKANLPRSTAYALTNPNRPGMPNPDHVALFLEACGLTVTQVELVTLLWETTREKVERDKSSRVRGTTSLAGSFDDLAYLDGGHRPRRREPRSATSWPELVRYVVVDPNRTKHAVRLLGIILFSTIGVGFALVYLAITLSGAPAVAAVVMIPTTYLALLALLRFGNPHSEAAHKPR